MRLSECNTESLLNLLRTFSYTTDVDGTPTTVNVELFPSTMTSAVNRIFLQKKGRLKCDELMEDYKNGDVTAQYICDCLKVMLVQQWKHFLEMWKIEYNPIWNVDGVETRTVETKYGKVTTQEYNSAMEREYDSTLTDDQTSDGKNNITHGKKTDYTEPTETDNVAAYDQATWVGKNQRSATTHYDEESGTTNAATSMGTVEHVHDGKDTDSHTGDDTERLSGTDEVKDTLERHGNIGVTMTQQLLTAESNFWEHFNFFDFWFTSIADELTIPIYE